MTTRNEGAMAPSSHIYHSLVPVPPQRHHITSGFALTGMTKARKHTETWLVIGTCTMTLMDSEPTVHGCLAKIFVHVHGRASGSNG